MSISSPQVALYLGNIDMLDKLEELAKLVIAEGLAALEIPSDIDMMLSLEIISDIALKCVELTVSASHESIGGDK